MRDLAKNIVKQRARYQCPDHNPVNQDLYNALLMMQHRGQDAAGIVTFAEGKLFQRKSNGLVRDVFQSH